MPLATNAIGWNMRVRNLVGFGALFMAIGTVAPAVAVIPPSAVGMRLVEITTGLAASGQFAPTDIAPVPDGSGRMAIATLGGKVRLIHAGGQPIDSAAGPYIAATSIATAERGTTAIAFHPDFAAAGTPGFGKVYTLLSEAAGTAAADFPVPGFAINHQQVLVEWSTTTPGASQPAFTRRDVIRFDQPRATHNLNDLVFDAAGFLYIASGDDVGTSQSVASYQGKMLRIDPLHPSVTDQAAVTTAASGTYSYPNANPFVGAGGGALPELYAIGLRNPYRTTFDRDTGVLYAGDVGGGLREEVDVVASGKNYGWPYREGTFQVVAPPSGTVLEDPILEYERTEGETVIGGYVYRGAALPGLVGSYVFAEFGRQVTPGQALSPARLFHGNVVTGDILELEPTGESLLSQFVFSVGEDAAGELYLLVGDDPVFGGAENPDGRVLKLMAPLEAVPLMAPAGVAVLALGIGVGLGVAARRRRYRRRDL
jgi:glucose/arabinose dehydrogenase